MTMIQVLTSVKWHDGAGKKERAWDKWQAFIKKERKNAPQGMQSLFQASEDWAHMTTLSAFRDTNAKVLIITIFLSQLL